MMCYICLKETGCASAACAICQRCGVGVCLEHLVEVRAQLPIGPGGSMNPIITRSMVCWRCYDGTTRSNRTRFAATTAHRQDGQQQRAVLTRLVHWCKKVCSRSHLQPLFPDPDDAIATVELFLKQHRSP